MNRIELNALLEMLDPDASFQITVDGKPIERVDVIKSTVEDPTQILLREDDSDPNSGIIAGILNPDSFRIELGISEIPDIIADMHPEIFPVMINSGNKMFRNKLKSVVETWRQEASLLQKSKYINKQDIWSLDGHKDLYLVFFIFFLYFFLRTKNKIILGRQRMPFFKDFTNLVKPKQSYDFDVVIENSNYSSELKGVRIVASIYVPYLIYVLDFLVDSNDLIQEKIYGQNFIKFKFNSAGDDGFLSDFDYVELMVIHSSFLLTQKEKISREKQVDRTPFQIICVERKNFFYCYKDDK